MRSFLLVLAGLAVLVLVSAEAEARLAPAARFGKANTGTSDNLEYRWGKTIAVKGFEPAVSVAYRVEVQVDDDAVLNDDPVGNWSVGSAPWFHVRASCTDSDPVLGCDIRLNYLKLMLIWDSGTGGEAYTPSELNTLSQSDWVYAEVTISDVVNVDGNWRNLGPLCATVGGSCQFAWTAGTGGGTSTGVMNGPSSNTAVNYVGTYRVVLVAEVSSGGTPNNIRAFNSDTCWYGPSATNPVYACNHAFYPTRSIGFIQVNPAPVSFEPRDAACAALDDQAMRGDTVCLRTQLAAAAWMNSADIRNVTPTPATPPTAESAHRAVYCYSETECWAGVLDTDLKRIGVRSLTLQSDNTLLVGPTHWLVTSTCQQAGCNPTPVNFRILYFPASSQLVVLYTANKNVDADLVTRYALSRSVWTWTGTSFTAAQADQMVISSATWSYRALHADTLTASSYVVCAGHTTTGTAAAVGCLVYENIAGAATFSVSFTTDQPFYPYVCARKTEATFYVTYTFQDTTARHMKILRFNKPTGGSWAQSGSRVDDSTSAPPPDLPTDRLGSACVVTSGAVMVVSMHDNDPLSRNAPRAGIRSFSSTLGSFIWARPFPLTDVSNYPLLTLHSGSIAGFAMDGTTGRLKARFWAMNGFPLSENMSISLGAGSTNTMDVLGSFTGTNAHKIVVPRGTGAFQVIELGVTSAYRVEVSQPGGQGLLNQPLTAAQATRTPTFQVGPTAALNEYQVNLLVEAYSGLAPSAWYNLGYTTEPAWPPTRTYTVTGRPDPDGGAYPAGGLFVEEKLLVDQCALDPGAPRPVAHRGEAIGWTCRVRDEWAQPHAAKPITGALAFQNADGGQSVGASISLLTATLGEAACPKGSCTSIPTGGVGPTAAADTYQGTSSQDEAPIQRANTVRITDASGGVYGTSGSWGEATPFFDVDNGLYIQGYWQGWSDTDQDRLDFNTGTDDAVGADGDHSRALVHNARSEPSNQYDNLRVVRTQKDPFTGATTSSTSLLLSPTGAGRYHLTWGAWPLWTTATVEYQFTAADSKGNTDVRFEEGTSPTKTGGKAHHLRARLDVLDTHVLRGQSQLATITVVDSYADKADNGVPDTSSPPLGGINGAWAHYLDASPTSLYTATFAGLSSPFSLVHTLDLTDPLGHRDVLLTLDESATRLRGREWINSPGLYDHHDRASAPSGAKAHWLITNHTDWARAGPTSNPDITSTPGQLRVGSAAAWASWGSQPRDLGPGTAGPTRASCTVTTSAGGRVLAWLNTSADNFQTETSGGQATYNGGGTGTLTLLWPTPAQRYYRLDLLLEGATTSVDECSLDHLPIAPTGLADDMGAWRADDLSVQQLQVNDTSLNLDEDPTLEVLAVFGYTQAPGPVRNESYATTIRLFKPDSTAPAVPGYVDKSVVTNAATTSDGRARALFTFTPQVQAGSPWSVTTGTASSPLVQTTFGVEARLANFTWWAHEGSHDAQHWKQAQTYNRGEEAKLVFEILNNPESFQPTGVLISDDQDGAPLSSQLPYDAAEKRLTGSWHWPSTTPAEAGSPHRPLVAFTLNGKAHLVQPPTSALLYRNFTLGNLWHAYSPTDTLEAESFVIGAHLLWEWADQFNVRGEAYMRSATYTWVHLEPESGLRSPQNPPRDPLDPATRSADHGPEPILNGGRSEAHWRTGIASVPVLAPAGRWSISATASDGMGNTATRTENVGFLSPVTPWSFQCSQPARAPRVGDHLNVSCWLAERQPDGTQRYVEPQNPVYVQFLTKDEGATAHVNLTPRQAMTLASPSPGTPRALAYYVQEVPPDLSLYRSHSLSYRIDTVYNGLAIDASRDVLLAPEETPFRIHPSYPIVLEPGRASSLRVQTTLQDPILGSIPYGPDSCLAPACRGDQEGTVRLSIKGWNDSCACWATYTRPDAVQNDGGNVLAFENMTRTGPASFTFNWTPPGGLSGKAFYVVIQATYYGRNVTSLSSFTVNTLGGTDPLSLHAPGQVYLGESFPLVVHAAYLNGTARHHAAAQLFVTILDPAGARLVEAAHPVEVGNGAYRLIVTPQTRGVHEAVVVTLDAAGNIQSASLAFRAEYDPYQNLTGLATQLGSARGSLESFVLGIQNYLSGRVNASDAARVELVATMQAYLSDHVNQTSTEERALLLAVQAYLSGAGNATKAQQDSLLLSMGSYLSGRTNTTASTTQSLLLATQNYLAVLVNQTSLSTQQAIASARAQSELLLNQSLIAHTQAHALLQQVQDVLWREENETRRQVLGHLNETTTEEHDLLLAVQSWLAGQINATSEATVTAMNDTAAVDRALLLAVQGYLAGRANQTSAQEQEILLAVRDALSLRVNATSGAHLALLLEVQGYLAANGNATSSTEAALLLAVQDELARATNASNASLASLLNESDSTQRALLLAVQGYLAARTNETSQQEQALLETLRLDLLSRLNEAHRAQLDLLVATQDYLAGRMNAASSAEGLLVLAVQDELARLVNASRATLLDAGNQTTAAEQALLLAVQAYLAASANDTSTQERQILLAVQEQLWAEQNATAGTVLAVQALLAGRLNDTSGQEQALLLSVQAFLAGHVNASSAQEQGLLLATRSYVSERINATLSGVQGVSQAALTMGRFESWVEGEYRPQTVKVNATTGGVQVLVAQLTREDTSQSELLAQVIGLNAVVDEMGRNQNQGITGMLVLQALTMDFLKLGIYGLAGALLVGLWVRLRRSRPHAPITRAVSRVAGPIARLVRYRSATMQVLRGGFKDNTPRRRLP